MLILMKNPWVRLVYISTCSILVLTIIVFVLKIYSESLQHGAYNHPLVQKPYHLIVSATTPDLGPVGQVEFYQNAHKKWPQAFLEVPIQMSRDGVSLVYPFEDLSKTGWGKDDVFNYTFAELKKMSNGHILSLEALLTALPNIPLWLKAMDQDPAMFQPAVVVLEKGERQNDVVIFSQMMDSYHYVFKEHPQWVFAGGTIHLQQLHILNSLFLPGLAKIKPDFFVFNIKDLNDQLLSKSAVEELNRRFKKIIFDGTVKEYEQIPAWLKIKIKGFLTKNPTHFFDLLDKY